MRDALSQLQEGYFRAQLGRHDKDGLLLRHIMTESGYFLCDHVWTKEIAQFEAIQARNSDRVRFYAKVTWYVRKNGRADVKLAGFREVERLA